MAQRLMVFWRTTRLRGGRASYGVGLESFILGFPIHFDFSWRTLFNKSWEDALFATTGGSTNFRFMVAVVNGQASVINSSTYLDYKYFIG